MATFSASRVACKTKGKSIHQSLFLTLMCKYTIEDRSAVLLCFFAHVARMSTNTARTGLAVSLCFQLFFPSYPHAECDL